MNTNQLNIVKRNPSQHGGYSYGSLNRVQIKKHPLNDGEDDCQDDEEEAKKESSKEAECEEDVARNSTIIQPILSSNSFRAKTICKTLSGVIVSLLFLLV